MQQVERKAATFNGSLSTEQLLEFRKFLEVSGLTVRDGSGDQFFHVRLPGSPRWVPVERGRGGSPVIRGGLQAYLDRFLSCPAPALEALRIRAGRADSFAGAGDETPPTPQLGKSAQDFPMPARCTKTPVTDQGSAIQVTRQLCPTAKSVDEAQYLSDLRDDFALHAPVVLPEVFTAEQLERFVQLRWRYADLMIKHRTTMAGD